MQTRKTWFAGVCIFLYLCGSAYTLISGMAGLGEGREYPYLYPAIVIVLLCAVVLLTLMAACIGARLQLPAWAERHAKMMMTLEWIGAVCILLASFAIRVVYVRMSPMTPESDYKTYYEIAQLINKNTLMEDGPGYCQYISMFPHVYGYSYALSLVLRLFGDSVWTGQVFNIVCAVAACFFVWRCAVMLAGRFSGFVALIVMAFWPSQILYNNFLAAEYLFSLLLYICLWLFLCLVRKRMDDGSPQGGLFCGHIVLGILLGITSAVRPMAMLLLISIVIYLVPSRVKLPIRPYNDLPVTARAMSRGWIRALLILAAFMVTTNITGKCVSYASDTEIAGGSASFGYNLLVGLNQDSYGGWNQEDADYLYGALDRTGSAQEAQKACRDLAMERLQAPLPSLLNLFFHKYSVLWGNDDYGSTWNLLFMGQQGNLTPAREAFYYAMRDYNNNYYMVLVAFSAIAVFALWHRRGSWLYVPVTLFLGTVAMHLLVENQNRYHFHALYLFAILGAAALHILYEECSDYIVGGEENRTRKRQQKQEEAAAYRRIEEAEHYADQKMEEHMQGSRLDMEEALREGHIRVSVSQAVSESEKMKTAGRHEEEAEKTVEEVAEGEADVKD